MTTSSSTARRARSPLRRVLFSVSNWRPGSASAAGVRQLYLLVALVAPALMFAAIWFMASQQNRDALRAEAARAASVQSYMLDRIALLGADNANWNEAYQHAGLRTDPDWIDGAWGPEAFGTIDLHDAYLLDDKGNTLYASILGKRSGLTAAQLLTNGLPELVAAAAGASPPRGAVGFARYADGLAIVNVTRIRPISEITDPAVPPRYLMMVKRIDPTALADVERASGFRDLAVSTAPVEGVSTPLRDVSSRIVGMLAWRSDAPGYASAMAVLPIALLVFALLAYAGFVGASNARRRAEELLVSQRQALRMAHRDPLTDLPNRRAFADSLDAAIAAGDAVAMLYMDLDGFKEVNDAFGHSVGDALLAQAGRRIAAESGAGVAIARFGGDEFAVLLKGPEIEERARRLAQLLVDSFTAPIEAAGRHVYAGASIGVSLGGDGIDGTELIRRSDVAMYAAKAGGKRRWRMYDEGMDRGRAVRRQIADELRQALASGDVLVSFQPVVEAMTGKIVGAEALARWSSPTLGIIDPVLFISVAEESGMISDLTRQVLRQACRSAVNWDISVSVNLSAAEVWDLAFADELLRILGETGLPASRLELEITESYLVKEPQAAADTLAMLRSLGVKIALDDFGMGFASMGQLRRLPLDRIKLTHEFLAEIAKGGNASEVATAFVALARAFDLPVTAEGVETEAQAELLRAAGCTHMQGWLFGKPMAAATLTKRLRGGRRLEAVS